MHFAIETNSQGQIAYDKKQIIKKKKTKKRKTDGNKNGQKWSIPHPQFSHMRF